MKNQNKVLGIVAAMVLGVSSCEKSDDENCKACNVEGVEICEVEGDKIGIFENGERRGDLIELPSDLAFDDATSQLCAEIERQVALAGGCYECTGPNVQDFDVCKTDEGITLAGELVPDSENITLEDAVSALEQNPDGADVFDGLNCSKN